jgi:large conductance mechanosensitive channel
MADIQREDLIVSGLPQISIAEKQFTGHIRSIEFRRGASRSNPL